MDKRKLNWITWAVLALAFLILILMLWGSLNHTSHITLPSSNPPREPAVGDGGTLKGTLTVVEITPETVQAAIASLSRPSGYSRGVTVEYFWEGGSGKQELYVLVQEPWTRIDRSLGGGQIRTSITDGQRTYIWYGDGVEMISLPAGDISADDEQSIPTYEEILELPAGRIAQADYQSLEGLNCIYVETAVDETGYSLRYWVSVDNGLLVQAEKLLEEKTVYRMTALSMEQAEPGGFVLPDGTALLDSKGEPPIE